MARKTSKKSSSKASTTSKTPRSSKTKSSKTSKRATSSRTSSLKSKTSNSSKKKRKLPTTPRSKTKKAKKSSSRVKSGKEKAKSKKTSPQTSKEIIFKKIEKFLKNPEVRRVLVNTAGENTIAVLKELTKVGEDEKIAERLNVKVSDVRAVLNVLHSEGLVFYERSRDENSGWYYYNWIINIEKIEKWVESKLNERKKMFYQLISSGEKYFCTNCGIESLYDFEDAMDLNFKCPTCNSSMEFLDEKKAREIFKINP